MDRLLRREGDVGRILRSAVISARSAIFLAVAGCHDELPEPGSADSYATRALISRAPRAAGLVTSPCSWTTMALGVAEIRYEPITSRPGPSIRGVCGLEAT